MEERGAVGDWRRPEGQGRGAGGEGSLRGKGAGVEGSWMGEELEGIGRELVGRELEGKSWGAGWEWRVAGWEGKRNEVEES